MLKLAWRNLTQERLRMGIGVAGVALAVLLILLVNGIFVGAEQSMVMYLNRQPVAFWLMQPGVENMHMAYSMLPPGLVERVRQVPGVEDAAGVLYAAANVQVGDTPIPSYIFGIDPGQTLGGPWKLTEGTTNLRLTQAIIDHSLAERYKLKVGETFDIRGFKLTITGLSDETFGFGSNIVFVNKTAMALSMGVSPQSASYVLVKPLQGTDLSILRERLKTAIPEANLKTKAEFVNSDMELARKMGSDVIRVMNVVAYVIGLLVIGISIYTITLERQREYGVLKAIGANTPHLLTVVFAQALTSACLGYLLGIVLAYVAETLIRTLSLTQIIIEPSGVLSQLPVLIAITLLAALMSVGRVIRLDPMVVFQS